MVRAWRSATEPPSCLRRSPRDQKTTISLLPVRQRWNYGRPIRRRRCSTSWAAASACSTQNTSRAGGQRQNLTFNWFTQLGVRNQLSKKLAVTGGLYFTHHSNLGMTKPNPGIDVLGLNFGLVWPID